MKGLDRGGEEGDGRNMKSKLNKTGGGKMIAMWPGTRSSSSPHPPFQARRKKNVSYLVRPKSKAFRSESQSLIGKHINVRGEPEEENQQQ